MDDDESDVFDLEGLFVGSLSNTDLERFERAVELKLARRSYEGVSGFMGLAKVRVNPI